MSCAAKAWSESNSSPGRNVRADIARCIGKRSGHGHKTPAGISQQGRRDGALTPPPCCDVIPSVARNLALAHGGRNQSGFLAAMKMAPLLGGGGG
jgi:hypothetical protein